MARRGNGLQTAIKIVKAIDKAQKQAASSKQQAARESERERKRRQRELAAHERELERQLKAAERASIAEKKVLRKAAKEHEKHLFESRVQERADLRAKFLRAELD